MYKRQVHDKRHAPGDGAELADDELVAKKWIVVGDALFETLRIHGVIVIGVVADENVGARDGVLDKTDAWNRRIGMYGICLLYTSGGIYRAYQ